MNQKGHSIVFAIWTIIDVFLIIVCVLLIATSVPFLGIFGVHALGGALPFTLIGVFGGLGILVELGIRTTIFVIQTKKRAGNQVKREVEVAEKQGITVPASKKTLSLKTHVTVYVIWTIIDVVVMIVCVILFLTSFPWLIIIPGYAAPYAGPFTLIAVVGFVSLVIELIIRTVFFARKVKQMKSQSSVASNQILPVNLQQPIHPVIQQQQLVQLPQQGFVQQQQLGQGKQVVQQLQPVVQHAHQQPAVQKVVLKLDEEVKKVLDSLKLSQFAETFRRESVVIEDLAFLNDDQLKRLIPLEIPRSRFQAYIIQQKNQNS